MKKDIEVLKEEVKLLRGMLGAVKGKVQNESASEEAKGWVSSVPTEQNNCFRGPLYRRIITILETDANFQSHVLKFW